MALTTVTLEGMQRALTDMGDSVSETGADARNVAGAVQGLSTTWQGEASRVFQMAFRQWNDNTNQILESMNLLISKMQASAVNYRDTEQVNQDEMNALLGQITNTPMAL